MHSGACKPTGTCSVLHCAQCFSNNNNCQECGRGYRVTSTGMCARGRNGAAFRTSTGTAALVASLVVAAGYVSTAW
jgi:hypothetical protein